MFSWAAISIPDTSGSPWFEDTSEMSCRGLCCEGMEVAVSPAVPLGLASCCHGWALAAGPLPPPGPPARPAAAPNQSYQLQTTHGHAVPQSNTRSGWLVAAASSQPFRPALVLLQCLPVQKPSGASGFSSHSAWVLEGRMLPFTPANNFGG